MSLLTKIKNKPSRNRTNLTARFTPKQLAEINGVIDAHHAGTLLDPSGLPYSLNEIRQAIMDEYGVTLGRTTFNEYANKRSIQTADKPSKQNRATATKRRR